MYPCRTEYTSSSWSQKLYKENKLQIVPHSLQLRRLAMPLSSPGESDQTLYLMDSAHQRYRLIHYWLLDSYKSTTAHSAHQRYWLIHYNCLIHQNPQPHCTPTLTPFLPVTYQHIILVLHQNSDVCKHLLPTKPGNGAFSRLASQNMGDAPVVVLWVTVTSCPQVIVTLMWVNNPTPEGHPSNQGSTYNRYGHRKEKG